MKRLFLKLDKPSTIGIRRNARKCLMTIPFNSPYTSSIRIKEAAKNPFFKERTWSALLNPRTSPLGNNDPKTILSGSEARVLESGSQKGCKFSTLPSIKMESRREVSELSGSIWSSLD